VNHSNRDSASIQYGSYNCSVEYPVARSKLIHRTTQSDLNLPQQ
jgi:hypothetical protein